MNLEFRSLEPISCKGEVAMSSKGNDSGIAAIGDFEPTADLSRNGVEEISSDLRRLLADVFALYLKTKNFHWHMSGRHFRDYHRLLDEQADQLFAMTDPIAERTRKIGGSTTHSIGQIGRLQRVLDNDSEYDSPLDMLAERLDDNTAL